MSSPVAGRPLSSAEQQQLTDLQALFKPADALKRVDDFAKWIFASIAVVGTLGAGLSNSAFGALNNGGKVLFGIAILLVGASLFASTLALEPEWVHANPSSRYSMLAAVNENLRKRRRPIRVAAVLFGLALVAAASAPLVSAFTGDKKPRLVLGYELKLDGKFTGLLTGTGLKPYTVLELRLEGGKGSKLWLAPSVRKSSDANGEASLSVDLDNAREAGSELRLTGGWGDSPLDLIKEPLPNPQVLSIPLPAPPPGAERSKTPSTESGKKTKPPTNITPETATKKSSGAPNEKTTKTVPSKKGVPDAKPQ
jgi:hypothetical protein